MQLPINALGMGLSTNYAHNQLVGCHDKGLKLAVLVLSK